MPICSQNRQIYFRQSAVYSQNTVQVIYDRHEAARQLSKEKHKKTSIHRLQNSRFFLKIGKEIGKAWHKSLARASHARRACEIFSVSPQSRCMVSASFQTFYLTARAHLNTQKYGLFCSLIHS